MANTKEKILDVAERLTQTQGFNGFSYLDLAEEVGIKTSSIHYYFKAKADLAEGLVSRTHESLRAAFEHLDESKSSPEKRLKSIITHFQSYVEQEKFCLCGMMSAELHSVGSPVRKRLVAYFTEFQDWIEKQFKEIGHRDAKKRALQFLSALEGALLLARLQAKPAILSQSLGDFIKK